MKYMVVKLSEISKGKYYAARTGKLDAERPLGFIMTQDSERWLYLSSDGKFYCGRLLPWQTNDMFMKMKFDEIRNVISAQFTVADAA